MIKKIIQSLSKCPICGYFAFNGQECLDCGYKEINKMLEKIAGSEPKFPCLSPEHNPPNMIVLSPGTYVHTCPSCGKKQTFRVDRTFC